MPLNFKQKTIATAIVMNAIFVGAMIFLIIQQLVTPVLIMVFALALLAFNLAFFFSRAKMRHSNSTYPAPSFAFQRSWAGLVLPGVIFLGSIGALIRFILSRDGTDLLLAAIGAGLGSMYYLRWRGRRLPAGRKT